MCITTAPHIRSCCLSTAPQVDLRWTSCNPLPPKKYTSTAPQVDLLWTSCNPLPPKKYTSTAPQVDLQTHVYTSQLSRRCTSTAPQVDLKRTASAPQAYSMQGILWHVAIITGITRKQFNHSSSKSSMTWVIQGRGMESHIGPVIEYDWWNQERDKGSNGYSLFTHTSKLYERVTPLDRSNYK